jgi:hypothetical protein
MQQSKIKKKLYSNYPISLGSSNHCNLACLLWSNNSEYPSSNHGLLSSVHNNVVSLAEIFIFSLIVSQALLTLCGWMMHICVFAFSAWKTDDANVRFQHIFHLHTLCTVLMCHRDQFTAQLCCQMFTQVLSISWPHS